MWFILITPVVKKGYNSDYMYHIPEIEKHGAMLQSLKRRKAKLASYKQFEAKRTEEISEVSPYPPVN